MYVIAIGLVFGVCWQVGFHMRIFFIRCRYFDSFFLFSQWQLSEEGDWSMITTNLHHFQEKSGHIGQNFSFVWYGNFVIWSGFFQIIPNATKWMPVLRRMGVKMITDPVILLCPARYCIHTYLSKGSFVQLCHVNMLRSYHAVLVKHLSYSLWCSKIAWVTWDLVKSPRTFI